MERKRAILTEQQTAIKGAVKWRRRSDFVFKHALCLVCQLVLNSVGSWEVKCAAYLPQLGPVVLMSGWDAVGFLGNLRLACMLSTEAAPKRCA